MADRIPAAANLAIASGKANPGSIARLSKVDPVSVLFAAVDRGDAAGAARLLDAAPLALHVRLHGATALHRAAARGDRALLELLIERGAELEAPDDSGATALSWASDENHDQAVDLLLQHGARASAVAHAARGNTLALARALAEAPWLLRERGSQGMPLHAAVRRGRLETVELLLEAGADLQERDEEGFTAAELARAARQPEIGILLERALSRREQSAAESGETTPEVTEALAYRCDACGEQIVIEADRTQGLEQQFIEDCPVCCRANVILVRFARAGEGTASAELE